MSAEVLTHNRFPPAAAARFCAELLNRHSPHEIACAIDLLIDLRDIMEGDPDAESEALEDDFTPIPADIAFGPGCSIADPCGQCTEDEVSTDLCAPSEVGGPGCTISDPGEDEVAL
jgi:hypothetical protein